MKPDEILTPVRLDWQPVEAKNLRSAKIMARRVARRAWYIRDDGAPWKPWGDGLHGHYWITSVNGMGRRGFFVLADGKSGYRVVYVMQCEKVGPGSDYRRMTVPVFQWG